MRVAITHTRYTDVGGVERYICSLVRRLLDAGHELHYFCHFWDDDAPSGIRFHRIPYWFKPIKFMKVWAFDRWSERMVEEEGPFDVVHGFTKTSRQDLYTDGAGCLEDYQEYSLTRGSLLRRVLGKWSPHQRVVLSIERARFTRGNFRKIVTMSELVADQIRSRYGLTPEEVEVVYNGIDLERFHPRNVDRHREEVRSEIGVDPDDPVVLFLGSDYRRKGLDTFQDALVRLDGVHGVVVGQESDRWEARFRERAGELGLADRLTFCGLRPDAERFFAAADLFCLPTRFDAFGMVVLEAMATGIPTVVSGAAGAAEVVVPDETGAVVEDPEDGAGFAAACRSLLADRPDPDRVRSEAERYSWDDHFRRILEIYEEIAAAKRTEGVPVPGG